MSGLIESIRKDQSDGTKHCDAVESEYRHTVYEVDADTRRREPDRVCRMEAALLAAEELAKAAAWVEGASPVGNYEDPMMAIERETLADIMRALAAYREAVK